MRKRARNIILLGLLFGGFLLLLRFVFKLSEGEVWSYYIIGSIIILVGAMGINIAWQKNLMKKVKCLEKILKDEQNPDKFIEENEKLLQTLKSSYNRAMIKINLSVGYCEKGEYETAKDILLSIPSKSLKGIHGVIYFVNLAYVYFRIEENQKALNILELHNKDFLCFKTNSSLGGSIAILRIFQYIVTNQPLEAQNLLTVEKEKWADHHFLEDWEFLQIKINELQEMNLDYH
ncbi:MAG: hypothetical protein ACERKN_10360 [Velocimicrobium sp.]